MERFNVVGLNNGKWLCTDSITGITVSWEAHRFNDTQQASVGDTDCNVMELASAMREMADYLRAHHYNKIF